jgi:capsular exopolysaccharide synthesis family protein
VDLGHILTVVRRRWWLVVVAALVCGVGGAAYTAVSTPQYKSTVTVFFQIDRGGTLGVLAEGSQYVQDLVPSYSRVARMPIVLDKVIANTGLDETSAQLANRITVNSEPSSVVLTVTVTDDDADDAARVANAVAVQLAEVVPDLSPIDQKTTAGSIGVQTLQQAVPAANPSSPNLTLNLALALAVGLILGLGAIVALELIVSSPVDSREAVHRITSAPVLATISTDSRFRQRPLSISTHPRLARSEEYRILQANLQILLPDSMCVVVTSALPSEGRTTTAANLAIGLSHARRRVLLVDAHFRNPALAGLLGIPGGVGLTSILSGAADPKDAVRSWTTQLWGESHLSVIPAGPPPGGRDGAMESGGLLDRRAMAELMTSWRADYDAVIIDTAPLLSSVDGISLAAQADGAVLVVDSRRTRERQVADSIERLDLAGARTLGVVLSRTEDTPGDYLDQEHTARRRLGRSSGVPFRSAGAQGGGRHDSAGSLLAPPAAEGPPAEVHDDGGVRANGRDGRGYEGQEQQRRAAADQ